MRTLYLFTLVILIIFQGAILSKPDYDSLVKAGINQIYSIKFSEAEKTFQILQKEYPKHPAGKFFFAMIDWWRIILSEENEEQDERFYEKIEETVDFCDEILDKDPNNVDALFFKGGAIGFRGRLRVMRESWFGAADDGREALPLVELAHKLDPDNVDVKLGFGIYNYLAAVIPEKYPIIKPVMMFFPTGNKELGLKQLKEAASVGKYSKYEAKYILVTFFYYFENDTSSAALYTKQLVQLFPDNPVFERWQGRLAARKAEWETVNKIFRSVLSKADKKQEGYNTPMVRREANYYIGNILRTKEELTEAFSYYKKCIEESKKIDEDKASGFRINATLYSGNIMETWGKYDEAKKYYNAVLKMREFNNSHTLAETYLARIKNLEQKGSK